MIILTLKFERANQKLDIQINKKQKIEDALRILCENGQIQGGIAEIPHYIISERKKERLNVRLTFEQANIYTGDILYI